MRIEPDPYCRDCAFLGREMGTCDYLIRMGSSRPCKPGAGCIVKLKRGGRVKTANWDTARADALRAEGRGVAEIAAQVGATEAAVRSYLSRRRVLGEAETAAPPAGGGMGLADLSAVLAELSLRYPEARVGVGGGAPVQGVSVSVQYRAGGAAEAVVLLEGK